MRIIGDISYGSDPAQVLKVYLPDGDTAKAAMLYLHGGGLEKGTHELKEGAYALIEQGYAIVSAQYRMYPQAHFPDYIEDSADAAAWMCAHLKEYIQCERLFIGGSSAGAYLSMMLFLDEYYLAERGLDAHAFEGYLFNAGQPTTHFNVLRERGLDERLIRVDEAAPIYFLNENTARTPAPRLLVMLAENDMAGRKEQTDMLMHTFRHFGYPEDRLQLITMNGFRHCKYDWNPDFVRTLADFMA